MDKDDNKRHYFSTLSGQEKADLFKRAAEESKDVGIWKKGASEQDLRTYGIAGFDGAASTFALEAPDASLFADLFETGFDDEEVLFKLTFERFHYCGQGLLSRAEGGGPCHLALVGDVFCGQQRENYRLKASNLVSIRFGFDGESFECADISAGGVGVLFDPNSPRALKAGRILKDCRIELCKRTYTVPKAKVVKVWNHEDDTGRPTSLVCAGVRFVGLPKETEERLFIQVNAEARGEEIQKKFFSG